MTKPFDPETNRPYHNDYDRTDWEDQIKDPVTEEILEEGTPFKADFANNMENGIYGAYDRIVLAEKEIRRLRTKIDLGDRTDSEYTFVNLYDGSDPTNMTFDNAKAQLMGEGSQLPEGKLLVTDPSPFRPGTVVTICDGVNSEDASIVSIDTDGHMVTLTKPLQHEYDRGSLVARSNAQVDDVNQQVIPLPIGSYVVEVTEI